MEKTVTIPLSEYEKMVKENEVVMSGRIMITTSFGYTEILSKYEAVQQMSNRMSALERELQRTLYWWQKRRA
jgi:hypothetical protein